jgi:putative ABC transport system permease protein
MTSFLRDLALGLRTLRRSPGFSATVLLTLALGVGANVAVFQLIEALVLGRLPVNTPERLTIVQLADMTRWNGRRTSGYPVLSNPLWERFRGTQTAFSGVLAWSNAEFRIGAGTAVREARGLFVSGDFFNVLGVRPLRGRVFAAADDRPGCEPAGVVVSHTFWQREMNADAQVVGRTLSVNGRRLDIVGVTPAGFNGVEIGRSFDVALPICSQAVVGREAGWLTDGTVWWLTVMGRLGPEQSLDRANAQLETMSGDLFRQTLPIGASADDASDHLSLRLRATLGAAGVSAVRDRFGDQLILLLVITCLVLLLICTNLATLILARASVRQRELAVRIALGGSIRHVVRQIAVEHSTLAIGGVAFGVMLSAVLSRELVSVLGPAVSVPLRVNLPLVAVASLCAVVVCLAFGLLPAWTASRSASGRAITAGLRGTSGAAAGLRTREVLVALQVAVSFILVFGALLFGGTLRNVLASDSGFQHADVIVARVDFASASIPQNQRAALKRDVLDRIRGVSGVAAAAEARHLPLSGTGSSATVWRSGAPPEEKTSIRINGVSDSYLRTMGMQLLAGRDFTAADSTSPARIAIVNPAFARRIGITGNPVGTTFRMEGDEADEVVEIVGLVANSKQFTLREDFLPIAFVPISQIVDPRPFTEFAIRPTAASGVLADVRRALDTMSPRVDVSFTPLVANVDRSVIRERLMAMLSAFFGVVGALIAVVGVYGVAVELVSRRKAEIGLRMALGARRAHVLAMMARQGGTLVVSGLALGALVVVGSADAARAFVFGVEPRDAAMLLTSSAILAGTALAAILWPSWRAASREPLAALRD